MAPNGHQPAVERQAVQDRPHGVLPHAEADVAPAGRVRRWKSPTPSSSVLFEGARSAEPPISSGRRGGDGVEHLARGLAGGHRAFASAVKPGSSASQPAGSSPASAFQLRGQLRVMPPRSSSNRARSSSASALSAVRNRLAEVVQRLVGTMELASRGQPSAFLVSLTSSAPERRAVRRGDPACSGCRSRCACGRMISEGRSVSAWAACDGRVDRPSRSLPSVDPDARASHRPRTACPRPR